MPFNEINNYIKNNLKDEVAAYLNECVKFRDAQNYFGMYNYFNEDTVKCVMLSCIKTWIGNYENPNHILVVSEIKYEGFNNKADLAVIFNDGTEAQCIYIELKADFTNTGVNTDIDVLDAVAGIENSPLKEGYAFYVVRKNDQGWTKHIDKPTQPNVVHTVAIIVN